MAGEKMMKGKSNEKDFEFEINLDGEIVITQYAGKSEIKEVVIPEKINGVDVVKIGDKAFFGNKALTTVTIPASVTDIGHEAFNECENLYAVNIYAYAERGRLSIAPEAFPEHTTINFIEEIVSDLKGRWFCLPEDLWDHEAAEDMSIKFGTKDKESALMHINYYRKARANEKNKWDLKDWIFSAPGNEFEIESISETECRITRYYRIASSGVVIPDSINGATVTEIGPSAFIHCKLLKRVTIPNTVTKIGEWAFYNCNRLESIIIPNSVTEFGKYAFSSCDCLKQITLPESIKELDHTFSECKSLTSVTIPFGVTKIGDAAFAECKSLSTIKLPDSVKEIGASAFRGCNSMKSFVISKGVINIGGNAFKTNGKNTMDISVDSENSLFSVEDGILYGKNKTLLVYYPSNKRRKSFIVPETVTEISGGAFINCKSLERIPLPSGLLSIGASAFYGCKNLKEILLPDSLNHIGESAFARCESLTRANIGSRVNRIEGNTFSGCANLTDLVIEDGASFIGGLAFSDCSSLTELTIPGSVKVISRFAFYNSGLTNVKISAGVKVIGDGAFSGCDDLKSITISPSVETIELITCSEVDAFDDCRNLEKIMVAAESKTLVSLAGVVFTHDMSKLLRYPPGKKQKKYTIPEGVTEIAPHAFQACANLTSVVLPPGVTEIKEHTFHSCVNLTKIELSDTITNIGWASFCGCKKLKSMAFPASIEIIDGDAFIGCSNLKTITIHKKKENVRINEDGFRGFPKDIKINYIETDQQDVPVKKVKKQSKGSQEIELLGIVNLNDKYEELAKEK